MRAHDKRGRSIRIFLADGTPEGIRLITKDNWSGIGVSFPPASSSQRRRRTKISAERASTS